MVGALAESTGIVRRRVGLVLTGGNVDASVLAEVLAGRTPA